jgi:hypothetical protein
MSFRVQAIELSDDFPNWQGFEMFSAFTSLEDLDNDNALGSICRKFFESVASGTNLFDWLAYSTEDQFDRLYIDCEYKNENCPSLNINNLKSNASAIKTSGYRSFSRAVDGRESLRCSVDRYDGVLLAGYYCSFSTLDILETDDSNQGNSGDEINLSAYKVHVFIFKFTDPTGSAANYQRILVVRMPVFFGNAFVEYLSDVDFVAVKAQAAAAGDTVHLEKRLYPWFLFSNTTKQIHDPLKSSSNLYPGISDTDPVIPPSANSMSCSTTLLGNVLIDIGGSISSSRDLQICPIGGTAKTQISKVSLSYTSDIILYKDLPTLSSSIQVYSYNFRYIYQLDYSGVYNLVYDAGSIQSATVNNTFGLNLSQYFAYKEYEDYFIFTYRFVTSTTDSSSLSAGASTYDLDVRVIARRPKITNNSFANPKVTILTDYSSKLVYDFNKGQPTEIDLSAFPSTNQSNDITASNQDSPLTVYASNFFYDFDSSNRVDTNRNKYLASVAREIDTVKAITSYKLEIVRNSSAQNFYDDAGLSVAAIGPITDLTQSGLPSSIYHFYSDYADSYDFYFKLTYSLASSLISSLTMKIGSRFQKLKTSPSGITISKGDLFNFLDKQSEVEIIVQTSDGFQFSAPFSFKNYSSSSPVCSSVSVTNVKYNSDSTATLSISVNYSYADSMVVSISGVDGEAINLPYSTSTATYEFTKKVPRDSPSVEVTATAKNINSSGGERSASSSTTQALLLKLRDVDPASVRFFFDSGLTNEFSDNVLKDQPLYIKFQLYDTNEAEIAIVDYPTYINTNPFPVFKLFSNGVDISDSDGVILDRVNDYVYLADISSSTKFDNVDVSIDYELLA